jgi:hypothetical protein
MLQGGGVKMPSDLEKRIRQHKKDADKAVHKPIDAVSDYLRIYDQCEQYPVDLHAGRGADINEHCFEILNDARGWLNDYKMPADVKAIYRRWLEGRIGPEEAKAELKEV